MREMVLTLSGLVLVISIGVGCSSEPELLTFEEYADRICPLDEGDFEGETWGDFRTVLEDLLGEYESVTTPTGLKKYHLAKTAMIKKTIEIAESKDQDAEANPYELLGEPSMLAFGWAIQEALDSITPKYQRLLMESGG